MFSPIRGTRSWAELVARGTLPDDLDPLLTNNAIYSALFAGYDPDELDTLKLVVKQYNSIVEACD